jgi:Ca2+-binding RTX toxin-like protein
MALLVADQQAFQGAGGGVIRVDPETGERTTVSSNPTSKGPEFTDPAGIAVDPATGEIYVADRGAFGGTGAVFRVDPVTGKRTLVSSNDSPSDGPGFVDPRGIGLAPNGSILIGDPSAEDTFGAVFRVNPDTGQRSILSGHPPFEGFNDPVGVIAPGEDAFVADRGAFSGVGAVWRIALATGERTLVSTNGMPSGGPDFEDPWGITMRGSGLLVSDTDAFGGSGGLIQVDPGSGERTTLSRNGTPAGGPDFVDPFGVVFDPALGIMVVDSGAFGGTGGIIGVDPTSGERTALSSNDSAEPSFRNPVAIAIEPNPPSRSGETNECRGKPATLVGSPKRDVLKGTSERDVIVALAGDDSIRAVGGNDVVCGDAGDDSLSGGSGRDFLDGGEGNDNLIGGGGGDTCSGGKGKRDEAHKSCERTPGVP